MGHKKHHTGSKEKVNQRQVKPVKPKKKFGFEYKPPPEYRPPKINLYKQISRKVYCLSFKHPVRGKQCNYSLGTRDEVEGEAIKLDLARILRKSELWSGKRNLLHAFNPKAVKCFFGSELPPPSGKVIVPSPELDFYWEPPKTINSQELVDARQKIARLEKDKFQLNEKLDSAKHEVAELRRKLNMHVKITLQDAVDKWKQVYPMHRNRHTVKNASTYVDAFVDDVDGSRSIGSIKHHHIDDWLTKFRNMKTGAVASPATIRKVRAYISSFFTWAFRHYDLNENPMSKTGPIPGLHRNPEHIKSIRNPKHLVNLIEQLQFNSYAQAWVAMACLAGLRWSEQVWLKTSDVYLDQGYIRVTSRSSGKQIMGTKTGRERTVPIEKTILHEVLKNYIEHRKNSQYPWLFPTKMKVGPRRFTQPGQWTINKSFKKWITPKLLKAQGTDKEGYWNFGPREWRHVFGTACGHSGHNSLEISRWMGNSPDIAERHYIAQLPVANRWPFKWTS